jgi:hypothetical protein
MLFPIATAPINKASDEKGKMVDAKKLPKNKPQRPQFSKAKKIILLLLHSL